MSEDATIFVLLRSDTQIKNGRQTNATVMNGCRNERLLAYLLRQVLGDALRDRVPGWERAGRVQPQTRRLPPRGRWCRRRPWRRPLELALAQRFGHLEHRARLVVQRRSPSPSEAFSRSWWSACRDPDVRQVRVGRSAFGESGLADHHQGSLREGGRREIGRRPIQRASDTSWVPSVVL